MQPLQFFPAIRARVDAIAAFLTDVREEGFNREYKSITGTYKGRRILAISPGWRAIHRDLCRRGWLISVSPI